MGTASRKEGQVIRKMYRRSIEEIAEHDAFRNVQDMVREIYKEIDLWRILLAVSNTLIISSWIIREWTR